VDGAYWAGLAAALERGDFRNGLSTAWPPLYPALVALLLRIAHRAGLAPGPATAEACARAVSVLGGTLLLVPLHALARRLLSPRAAAIAVLLAAFHPRLLQYSAAALSEATFALLLVGALALLVASEESEGIAATSREAASGALFGLAYLARPEGLLLAAAAWVVGLFRGRSAATPNAGRSFIVRLRPAFVVAVLVVALPWLMFLHGTLGRWSLGEKGGYNFWRAFASEYAADFPVPAGLAARVNESPEIAPAPSTGGVHVLEFALQHPGVVIARCARNLATIVVSTLPVTLYWALVPLAVLALLRVWPPGAWPLAVTLGALPVLYAPFSVDRRFFAPAVPLLLVACAAGIERGESWLARRAGSAARARRGVNAALAVIVTLAVVYAFTKGSGFDQAPEHRRAGEWLARNGASAATKGERPIVMSRKPWVAFYSGGLIAALPEVAPDSLVALARARGALLVADERSARSDRPRLAPLLDAGEPTAGLTAIHREPGPPSLVLYRPLP
jgi:4-amino-4-deoxy-L-arabinose transferase-like glycosyltransferase